MQLKKIDRQQCKEYGPQDKIFLRNFSARLTAQAGQVEISLQSETHSRRQMASPVETTSPAAYTLKTILKFKPFRTLWLAQFVSIFGDFLALFGVISLITFRWHGTALQVTAVIIAYMLPIAIISPVAGVFVDHWNVKRLMIASDLIRAGLILLLVFAHDITQISAIFIVLSAVSSFFAPAQSVTLRTIVPPEGLLAANALMAQAFYVVRLLSPAAAGMLVA